MKTAQQRFDEKWEPITESGCWIWTASTTNRGYGLFWHNRLQYAHRISWALLNGDIPEGMYVCHKCDVPSCVNPTHLYVGTQYDNMRDMCERGRGRQGYPKQTHCKRGHEFSETNTYIDKAAKRKCRICNRERKRKAYWKKKSKL